MSKTGRILFQMALFASFGTLMFLSDIAMEALPNIHLIGMFTVTFTAVYRYKALIPLYVYVFLNGVYGGFSSWWIPYLYVWAVLWGMAMLLPKRMHPAVATFVYMAVAGLHGLMFGTLYAPSQVLLFFGGDFSKMVPWIISGLPFDVMHCIGNVFAGILILPLVKALTSLHKRVPISPNKRTLGNKS